MNSKRNSALCTVHSALKVILHFAFCILHFSLAMSQASAAPDTLRVATIDTVLCEGRTGVYATNIKGKVHWRVLDADSAVVAEASSDTLRYTFPAPGAYRVVATRRGQGTAVQFVTVHAAPPAITVVDGPSEVCQGFSAFFTATTTQPGCYLRWEPMSSTTLPHSVEGSDATFTFGDEILGIRVYQIDGRYGCRSQAYIHPVDTFRLRPLGIDEPLVVCAGQTLRIDIPDQSDNVLYEWTIGPTFAASVLGDHLAPSVDVITNHTSLPLPMTAVATVERKYCGTESYDGVQITIVGAPSPTMDYDAVVCQGEYAHFTVQGESAPQVCHWVFDNGVANGQEVYHSFNTAGTHHFMLFYSEDSTCSTVQLYGTVTVFPHPEAHISLTGDTLMVVSSDSLTYQWLHNGDTIGNTGSYVIIEGDTSYCCIVSLTTAPYCSRTVCFMQAEQCDSLLLSVDTVVCNTAEIHVVGNPPTPVHWMVSPNPDGTYCSPATSAGTTTLQTSVAGNFTVNAIAADSLRCYSGNCTVTIPCVLNFNAVCDCSGHVVFTDNSSYISGMAHHPARTFTVLDHSGYSVVMPSSSDTASLTIGGLPAGYYTMEMSATINGNTCAFTKDVYIGTRPDITQVDVPNPVCAGTPFECSAVVSSDATLFRWDFGDGSYNFGNNIFHTYDGGQNHTITLIISNTAGCNDTTSLQINTVENDIDGEIGFVSSNPVCPGQPRLIVHDYFTSPSATYIWQYTDTTTNNFYNTYQTGDYRVLIVNHQGCRHESIINVGFLNAPTAHITGEAQFCYGQQVEFFGNSGEDNTYSWVVADAAAPVLQSTTPNISYLPTSAGSYTAQLTVTNTEGCSAMATHGFTVRPQLPAPVLGLVAPYTCMSKPPVHVAEVSNMPLFWSNGYHGTEAQYYTSGYISAYYLSADSVCRSESANFYIQPAPNYDALLTGCYEKCKGFFPATLPLYRLLPSIPVFWKWFWNQSQIQQGSYIDATLNLPGHGKYYLDTQFGTNCRSQSPTLTIVDKEPCPCDVKAYAKTYCFTKECTMMIQVYNTL